VIAKAGIPRITASIIAINKEMAAAPCSSPVVTKGNMKKTAKETNIKLSITYMIVRGILKFLCLFVFTKLILPFVLMAIKTLMLSARATVDVSI
jgi:hypothetical protein